MILLKTPSFYFAIISLIVAAIFSNATLEKPFEKIYAQQPSIAPFQKYIAANGIIEAIDDNIKVASSQSGVIEKIFYKVGDKVSYGTPLIQLDTKISEKKVELQRQNLNIAVANYEKTKALFDRVEAVDDFKSVSKEEIDLRKADYRIAEAKVKAEEAHYLLALEELDQLTIRAPIEGTLLQQPLKEGEYLSREQSEIIIGNIDRLQVRTDIDEFNVAKFLPSSPAVATPKNETSLTIPLSFEKIEPLMIPKKSLTGFSGERVDTRVLQVIYSFPPPEGAALYVGLQVNVYIEIP